LEKTVHQQADFKFIDVNEMAPFRFQHHCLHSALYSASELQNIIEHEKCTEQNHTIDVLLTRYSASCSGSTRNLALPESDSQNLEFIADSEALLKISDKKAYQITLLKITAHENCVALSNHFINH
jgi:hypothetical protein